VGGKLLARFENIIPHGHNFRLIIQANCVHVFVVSFKLKLECGQVVKVGALNR